MTDVDAVVVGAGPNGLAAAVAIAREGYSVTVLEARGEIGGGTRSAELTVPGVLHDVCSAVHPFGAGSPFFRSLPLEEHGLTWRHPEVALAHPLDGGRAAAGHRSVEDTAAGLGRDGAAWRRTYEPLARGFDDLADDLFRPILHLPRHPLRLARFGLQALQPATWLARRFEGEEARALFGGIAAHAIHPLDRPTTAGIGLMMGAAGHAVGWPVAEGGSQTITRALASLLRSHGGRIETGVAVDDLAEIPRCRVALLDVSVRGLLEIAGDRLPDRVARQLRGWRQGPAAFKLDLAVEGGVPWEAEVCRRAGTVHLGGTLEEIVAAERAVHEGEMPDRPFVLLAQQSLADPSRAAGDVHPVWTYAHVPYRWVGDATEAILGQLERFAPGVRDRIVGTRAWSTADLEAYNRNNVGGDIAGGATDPWQVVIRPRLAADPYATGIPGVFLCSSATPPGAGVHGMCGANAARSALEVLRR